MWTVQDLLAVIKMIVENPKLMKKGRSCSKLLRRMVSETYDACYKKNAAKQLNKLEPKADDDVAKEFFLFCHFCRKLIELQIE